MLRLLLLPMELPAVPKVARRVLAAREDCILFGWIVVLERWAMSGGVVCCVAEIKRCRWNDEGLLCWQSQPCAVRSSLSRSCSFVCSRKKSFGNFPRCL